MHCNFTPPVLACSEAMCRKTLAALPHCQFLQQRALAKVHGGNHSFADLQEKSTLSLEKLIAVSLILTMQLSIDKATSLMAVEESLPESDVHSFGPLLTTWGLWTDPCQGDFTSTTPIL